MVNSYGLAYFPHDAGSLEGFIKERTGEDPRGPKAYDDHITLFCGVDLGKRLDYSCACAVEQQYTRDGRAHYFLKNLQRFRLGSPYTIIARSIHKMDQQLRQYAAKQGKKAWISWGIEANSVGEAVVELIERELGDSAQLFKIYVTSGFSPSVDYTGTGGTIKAPKGQILSHLVALIDSGQLHFSTQTRQVDILLDELANYQIHLSESTGHDTYGAKVGKHDDTVMALAHSCYLGSFQPYQPKLVW